MINFKIYIDKQFAFNFTYETNVKNTAALNKKLKEYLKIDNDIIALLTDEAALRVSKFTGPLSEHDDRDLLENSFKAIGIFETRLQREIFHSIKIEKIKLDDIKLV